jgi:osmotically-inducible protein OsmY
MSLVYQSRLEEAGIARRLIVRRVHNGLLALTAALSLAMAGVACDNTARGVQQDTAEATDSASDAAAAARAEADDEADDARRTSGSATGAVDAAGETIDVKTALMTDDLVDASDINVDTFHETRTVVLKGTVPTEAQKTAAGRIAEREAEGYTINNQLTVRAR